MLGRGKKTVSGGTTVIAAGTKIVGDIKFTGHLEIEGEVSGNILASVEKDAFVRILNQGRVDGDIRAPIIVINGTVTGDVYSINHIELAEKAKVTGDVHYSVIEMAKGAHVNGSLVFEAGSEKKPMTVTSLANSKQSVNS